MSGTMSAIRRSVLRLRRDRRGVGAVEFALIAPVLIVLYIGSLEISVAMSVNKKIARAASTVADLVTQQTTVNKDFLLSMVDVAKSVITPFKADGLKVRVIGIKIDGAGKPKVAWSWDETNKPVYAVGSDISIPAELVLNDSFLVRTDVAMDYQMLMILPALKDVQIKTLKMSKTYHLRQRIADDVSCSNC
jgi:TadE-like protein.